MTVEELRDAKREIRTLQNKQDKIFDSVMKKFPKKKRKEFPDLDHQVMDYLFNNIYYKLADERRFLKSLVLEELLLDKEEELI